MVDLRKKKRGMRGGDDIDDEEDIPRKPKINIFGKFKEWMDGAFRPEDKYDEDDDY